MFHVVKKRESYCCIIYRTIPPHYVLRTYMLISYASASFRTVLYRGALL